MSKTLCNRPKVEYRRFKRLTQRQIRLLNDTALGILFGPLVGEHSCRLPCFVNDQREIERAALRRRGDYHAEL